MGDFNTVFLVNATNQVEADIIRAKLLSFGIKSMYKDKETGEVLKVIMGSSPYGVDIYVAEDDFDKAYEIVKDNTDVAFEEFDDTVFDEEKIIKEGNFTRSNRIWQIIIAIIILLLGLFFIKKI